MQSPTGNLRRFSLAIVLAGLLLAGIIVPIRNEALADHVGFTCSPFYGDWDETTATCTVNEIGTSGWGLQVPPTMTLIISETFTSEPDIVGPGPGVLYIEDIIVNGHLVIVNEAVNYGPVLVNGRMTISGAWRNYADSRYACHFAHGCAYSEVKGVVTNRGEWSSSGHLSMPYGTVNEGHWLNNGTVDAAGALVNLGHFTNTGIVTTTGTIWNMGQIHSSGLLINHGTIFNTGLLSATIANDGVIYSMSVLSGTIEGDGQVYFLQEHVYLPLVSK